MDIERSYTFIFSIFNEYENEIFWKNLTLLKSSNFPYIIIDGGSFDSTHDQLQRLDADFHVIPHSTRGQRFSSALNFIKTTHCLFIHPRTSFDKQIFSSLNDLPHSPW